MKDQLHSKKIEIINNFIEEKFPNQKNFKLIDFGCGTGRLLKEINIDHKTGVDVNKKFLSEVRKKGITTIEADLSKKLKIKSKSFDMGLCLEVLEHVYDFENLLSEISRIIKNEGILFVSVPYHSLLKNIVVATLNFEKHFGLLQKYDSTRHINFFTEKSLKLFLEKNNFVILKTIKIGRFKFLEKDMFLICQNLNNNKI